MDRIKMVWIVLTPFLKNRFFSDFTHIKKTLEIINFLIYIIFNFQQLLTIVIQQPQFIFVNPQFFFSQ